MLRSRLPNLSLAVVTASYLIQLGAGIFALSVVGRVLVAAPPRSLALLEGTYNYDSGAFWQVVPPITGLLLLIALAANWRTRRREWIISALVMFVTAGVLTGALLEPMFSQVVAGGFRDAVDPELQRRAFAWYVSDWALRGLDGAASAFLLIALTRPPETRT